MRRLYTASAIACNEPRVFFPLYQNKEHFDQSTNNVDSVTTPEVNSKLKELVKTGHLEDARQVFDTMSYRDVVTWTTMISGYVNASDSSEGLSLFSKLWVEPNVGMDPFVLSVALKACGLNLNVTYGELLHGYSVKTGFVNSVFVGSAILDTYMKIGRIWDGCKVFDEMPLRNVVSWTAIITGLVRAGYNHEGLRYFSEMSRTREEYDSYTFAIALKACADTGALDYGREIHTQAMKKGLDVSSFVVNTLATMYNKCGKLKYGLCLFERMTTKDVVSWTTIITTYVQMGQENHAVQAFLRMRESEVCPNEYTFAAVISACASLARMEWGEQLHAHVLALGGCGEEAFKFLAWMRREGPKPTEFAVASVLSVCGNMAILDQGKQLHAYVLSIGLEHTAMIRSDAESMIRNMPYNRDDVVWSTLLRACRVHGDAERGKRAADQILELDPNCAGAHIAMSNIYAAKGRWRESAVVRKLLRSKGVIKEPGWSWIKVKDQVSAFVAGDRTHPKCVNIYGILDLLASREEVAVQETSSFLFDAEDLQKFELLYPLEV
ncbi:tetratricopeptide repeat (TPR)-like superfamily protein [Actinidia rufa]|uniref:Tetratricopeptide repeat (TPR)-like superfamily protein n=1 Tax=Actinidia rufa TaxID=165716 RepID=A0A7J0E1J3_9ERIC|nr:tetratricopeptide repeat (TPR)-like superfamily protein [Actinidia rufa]